MTIATSSALTALDPSLDGFEAVPADAMPFITLDSQKRFYLNASLRKLVGIKAYDRIALAYNPAEHTLAILTGESARAVNSTSYFVDKRYYMSARRFMREYRYSEEQAPYTFELDRAGTADGVYLFKLTGLKLVADME